VSIHALFAVDMDKTIFNINEISIANSAEQFYSLYLLLRFSTGNYFFDPLLTLRLLMSYIYGAPILDVSRSHTTTQHSR
jgi:hypothetical protein